MFRAAAAAALRKKQPSQQQRRPAKTSAKGEGSGARGRDLREGRYDSERLTPKLASFDLEKAFRIKFSEVNSGNEECVYYKDDENRFTQRYTLKLRTNRKYKVSIEVEEGTQVLYIKLGDVLWNKFLVVPNPRKHSTKVEYTFLWNTDQMNLTVRKNRAVLPFAIKLRNHTEIEFAALVKFYNEETENHSKGVPLSFLSLDDSEEGTWKIIKRGNRKIYKLKFN